MRRLNKPKEAADRLNKSVGWLNNARVYGGGPAYLKIGGRIYYEDEALDAFLDGCRRTSTSDERAPTPVAA